MEDRPNWLSGRRPTTLTGAFARTTSSDSGSSLGSPSPAAKPRWNTDYAGKLHTRTSSEDLTEDENTKPSYTRPQLSPNSRRLRNQELMQRALEAPPLFVNKGHREKPTFAAVNRARREKGARIEETTRELARKSSMSSMGSMGGRNDNDQPLPPPNVPKTWGSRARKQPHWIQKILSPDLPGATQEEMDVLFQKPHPPPFDNPPTSTTDTGARELTPPASRPASAQPQYANNDYYSASAASGQPRYVEDDYFTGSAASVQSEQPQYADDDHYATLAQPRYTDNERYAASAQHFVENNYFTGSAASVQSEQSQYVDIDSFTTTSPASIRSQELQNADSDYYTRSLAGIEPQHQDNVYTVPATSVRYQPQYDEEITTPSSTDDQFTSRSIEVSQSPALRFATMTKATTPLLDEIREREIETLALRAVATGRLGEIRERNSEERDISLVSVRRFSRSPAPVLSKINNPESPKEATEEIPYDPNYKTILEEEGYPIPGTPVWVMSEEAYQAKTGCGPYVQDPEGTYQTLRQLAKLLSPQNSPVEQKIKEDKDVTEKTEQEMATIEKLPESVEAVSEAAEIAGGGLVEENREIFRSGSPQENPAAEKPVEPTLRNKILDVEGSNKRCSTASSDVDPEDRITAEAKLFELQDNKSERNSWSAPSRSRSLSPAADLEETPKPAKVDPLSLPTPRVTGAYVETPAPSERKPRKQRSSSSRDTVDREDKRYSSYNSSGSEDNLTSSSQQTALEGTRRTQLATSRQGSDDKRRSRSSSQRSSDSEGPKRPDSPHPVHTRKARFPLINTATIYSAAEDVRQLELAAGLDGSDVDDSTLDAFATTMEQNVASPSAVNPIDSLIYDEAGFPLSQKQREQKLEMLHYERMSKRLYNTSSGIRQTTRGISRITNTLTTLPDPVPQPHVEPVIEAPIQPTVKTSRSTKLKFNVESEVVDADFELNIEWSKLFWQNTEQVLAHGRHGGNSAHGQKLTWLGYIFFMLFLFATWYVAESATCGVFCKPKYASNNNWNYKDPSFPFAIPTKLDQWTGSIVSTSLSNTYEYFEGMVNLDAARMNYHSQPNAPNGSKDWWTGRGGAVGVDIPEASTFDDDEIL